MLDISETMGAAEFVNKLEDSGVSISPEELSKYVSMNGPKWGVEVFYQISLDEDIDWWTPEHSEVFLDSLLEAVAFSTNDNDFGNDLFFVLYVGERRNGFEREDDDPYRFSEEAVKKVVQVFQKNIPPELGYLVLTGYLDLPVSPEKTFESVKKAGSKGVFLLTLMMLTHGEDMSKQFGFDFSDLLSIVLETLDSLRSISNDGPGCAEFLNWNGWKVARTPLVPLDSQNDYEKEAWVAAENVFGAVVSFSKGRMDEFTERMINACTKTFIPDFITPMSKMFIVFLEKALSVEFEGVDVSEMSSFASARACWLARSGKNYASKDLNGKEFWERLLFETTAELAAREENCGDAIFL